jgi:hypothetical protein
MVGQPLTLAELYAQLQGCSAEPPKAIGFTS